MDPVKCRLDRRRHRIVQRVAMIEAAGELREPGGEIAFAALHEEMEFLRDLYEVMLLAAIRRNLLSDLLSG